MSHPTHMHVPPSSARLMVNGGNELDVTLAMTKEECPPEIEVALTERLGWSRNGIHPDSYEPMFSKNTVTYSMRWYEALAYEFYRFMNIGV